MFQYENNIELFWKAYDELGDYDSNNESKIQYYYQVFTDKHNVFYQKYGALCKDPDATDENLYKCYVDYIGADFKIKRFYGCPRLTHDDFKDTSFTLDALCGWKQLYKFFNGNPDKWIPAYKSVRSNLAGHLLWPCHVESINTNRYTYFKDRIDFTLIDIRNFYMLLADFSQDKERLYTEIKKMCCLNKAILKESKGKQLTFQFLDSFTTYDNFADKMKLNHWKLPKDKGFSKVKVSKNIVFDEQYWNYIQAVLEQSTAKLIDNY